MLVRDYLDESRAEHPLMLRGVRHSASCDVWRRPDEFRGERPCSCGAGDGSVTDLTYRELRPEPGPPVWAWVVTLKWQQGGKQRGDYRVFSDKPSENEVAAAVLSIKRQHDVE